MGWSEDVGAVDVMDGAGATVGLGDDRTRRGTAGPVTASLDEALAAMRAEAAVGERTVGTTLDEAVWEGVGLMGSVGTGTVAGGARHAGSAGDRQVAGGASGVFVAYDVATPLGPFTLIANEDIVRAAGFTTDIGKLARLASIDVESVDCGGLGALAAGVEGVAGVVEGSVGVRVGVEGTGAGAGTSAGTGAGAKGTGAAVPHPAIAAVNAYFAGDLRAIDAVQCAEKETLAPFTSAARTALRAIPAGTTLTYTELAACVGRPAAVRAAGSACATNPVSLFVPCHRVLRTDGSLGGYLYGLDIKRALLAHEGA